MTWNKCLPNYERSPLQSYIDYPQIWSLRKRNGMAGSYIGWVYCCQYMGCVWSLVCTQNRDKIMPYTKPSKTIHMYTTIHIYKCWEREPGLTCHLKPLPELCSFAVLTTHRSYGFSSLCWNGPSACSLKTREYLIGWLVHPLKYSVTSYRPYFQVLSIANHIKV